MRVGTFNQEYQEVIRTQLETTGGSVNNGVIKREIIEQNPENFCKFQTIKYRYRYCKGE